MKRFIDKFIMKAFASSGQRHAGTQRLDPYKNYNYEVAISGSMSFAKAGFQKVSGLKTSAEVIEYREGGDNLTKHKMPGLVNFEPVVLERGMSDDTDMWDYMMRVMDLDNAEVDPNFRCVVDITLKDRNHKPIRAWQLQRAWVSDYETGDFDAESGAVLIERITLQHESLQKTMG